MAKKKMTHKTNDNNEPNPQEVKNRNQTDEKSHRTPTHHPTAMEEASEKLQNLKNLNSMLLKETIERRQQVDSLAYAKEDLEAELSRFADEKTELVARLNRESEKNETLEIQKGVFCVFVMTQMREMGVLIHEEKSEREDEISSLKSKVNEILVDLESERRRSSQACRQRDLMKGDLDCQVQEANGFKERLIQMEKEEKKFKDEILALKNECEGLRKEKNERSIDMEAVKKEKGLIEKRLVETAKEIDDLKGKVEGIVREKKEIEMEKTKQKIKINELEKEVGKLNEIVLEFQKEEKLLREKILGLERSYSEAVDKEGKMALEINALTDQKGEQRRSIEWLTEEKEKISQKLEATMVELNDKDRQIEKLLREKNEVEEREVSKKSEIVRLHEEIGELRDAIFSLKESCRVQEEKSRGLVNEVSHYKSTLDRVMLERDDAKRVLDGEKKNVTRLMSKLSDMEERMEVNLEELAKMRKDREVQVEEKKKMANQIRMLMEEKELVQKNLLEVKKGADDLRAKMESIGNNSYRALSLLKKTAALVCQSKDDSDEKGEVDVNDKKREDENYPYEAELEAIKNAFRNKEKVVEDMKRQVEFMQNSVAEARKKKSFWTLVSSATTIFAAASVAYVARIR